MFPTIPASLRRRLPRLSTRQAESEGNGSGSNLQCALASSSEPHLPYHHPSTQPEASDSRRPATVGEELHSFETGSGKSDSPRVEDAGSPTKYESESGLRWNRVVPAFNLLRNAGYEAQQPQADGRLARSLYLNALVYLLDALPPDLTSEESSMLQHRLPQSLQSSLHACPGSHRTRLDNSDPSSPNFNSPTKSYLHRLLASTIVQIFLLVRFLLPYFKVLLHQLYEYERSHRITERIVNTTLDAADGLSKGSFSVGSVVFNRNEGRVGTAASNLAAWWIEGVAGGIYEGVGEGMVQLGFIRDSELDRITLQTVRRL